MSKCINDKQESKPKPYKKEEEVILEIDQIQGDIVFGFRKENLSILIVDFDLEEGKNNKKKS